MLIGLGKGCHTKKFGFSTIRHKKQLKRPKIIHVIFKISEKSYRKKINKKL
jgi:hypothetical protein